MRFRGGLTGFFVRMMSAWGANGVGAAEGGRTDDDDEVVLVVLDDEAALPRPSPSVALDVVVWPSASVTARRTAASASMSARRGTRTTMAGWEGKWLDERGWAQQVSCLQ